MTGQNLGYARVSTKKQDLTLQIEALEAAGCTKIFSEKQSGVNKQREELSRLLDYAREGDVLVTTRLDRIARSANDLLNLTTRLKDNGVGLKSLNEPWADTTTSFGDLIITIMAGLAQFQRDLILERTNAGRNQAMKRGVKFGRKPKVSDTTIKLLAEKRKKDPNPQDVHDLAESEGVHFSTIYRRLKQFEDQKTLGENHDSH